MCNDPDSVWHDLMNYSRTKHEHEANMLKLKIKHQEGTLAEYRLKVEDLEEIISKLETRDSLAVERLNRMFTDIQNVRDLLDEA